MTEWRIIVDDDGNKWENYEINYDGEIRSINYRNTGKTKNLRQGKDIHNYSVVHLSRNGKTRVFKVHRLVAFTYSDLIPNDNPTEKTQINHIDENKQNNHYSNLEWTTPKENSNHGTRTERSAKARSKKVMCIETGIIYNSIGQAERETEISHIGDCCLGKRKTSGGLHWEFVD